MNINNHQFKNLMVFLLDRGILAIRETIQKNPQFAFEMSDAIHNLPSYIDNPGAYIIEKEVLRALSLIKDTARQQSVDENFVGRDGFSRYDEEIETMSFVYTNEGEYCGVKNKDGVFIVHHVRDLKKPETMSDKKPCLKNN